MSAHTQPGAIPLGAYPTPPAADLPPIELDAPISTWYRVGGRAERLARPRSQDQLLACLAIDPDLLMLGAGANLIVDDAGVSQLVVKLDAPCFRHVTINESSATVHAGAGADLPKLILQTTRAGLGGLEGLAGIPGVIGGAAVMNAGGRFAEFAEFVHRVHAITRDGERIELTRDEAKFGYRSSALTDLIVTAVDLQLSQANPVALRTRLKEIMEYKKHSQPMSAHCAGCAFRNPRIEREIPGLASIGDTVSAGLLIDRAGCKGMRRGGAVVSDRHANFITAGPGASARDVIALMDDAATAVRDRFGVDLRREVVVWTRAS